MQQDEKQNVPRETLEGSVDMFDIARVAQDVEAREFAGMGSLKLVAPAKVNLYLNVKGVRDDGYHEVSTTMHALMLHDVLRMKIIPGTGEAVKLTTRSFEGLAPLDVDPRDNIVVKAILKLAEAFGRTLGEEETMRVHLEKRIPVQAGLGGGSSDAAAALLGSAVLWGESVLDPRIKEVAAQLGADVVFFLQGGCALYDGIGENLVRTLKPMNDFLVLVKPEGGVSTAESYKKIDEDPQPISAEDAQAAESAEYAMSVPLLNNMAKASEQLNPGIRTVREWLQEQPGVCNAMMSGSGAAVFAVCDSFASAAKVATDAQAKGWWARTTTFGPFKATLTTNC